MDAPGGEDLHHRQLAGAARAAGGDDRADREPLPSEILFEKDGLQINAKSIMGVLTLAAGQGVARGGGLRGEDAAEALAALAKVFESGFGER